MAKHTIMVVGGAGYIGSHMVKDLLQANCKVITLDDFSTGHRDLLLGGKLIEGNLGDTALLNRIFSDHRIEVVMHFAAYSIVGESVKSPIGYYRNNVANTIELLDAMVQHNVKRFIFSSSAAVYGEPIEVPIREEHPLRPTNPYGTTKVAIEQMLSDFDSAYGLKYVSLRYFNAAGADASGKIGERHNPETHLIPLILKVAMGEHNSIKIFGTDYPTKDGTCIRDYIHVSDLTQAHFLAVEKLIAGGDSAIYNLGNNRGYSVREVIEIAAKVTEKQIPAIVDGRRSGDPAVLIANSDKIRKELGWQPHFGDLETILRTAWLWHQNDASHIKN
jgi:UDP-glucose 4-epimerase